MAGYFFWLGASANQEAENLARRDRSLFGTGFLVEHESGALEYIPPQFAMIGMDLARP